MTSYLTIAFAARAAAGVTSGAPDDEAEGGAPIAVAPREAARAR